MQRANTRKPSRVCPISNTYSARRQLWYAFGLSVLDRIFRLASSCYRRSFHRRHVPTAETSIRLVSLGNRRSLRARARSISRWICRHGRGMDMDNLGADVAVRRVLGSALLLPT